MQEIYIVRQHSYYEGRGSAGSRLAVYATYELALAAIEQLTEKNDDRSLSWSIEKRYSK